MASNTENQCSYKTSNVEYDNYNLQAYPIDLDLGYLNYCNSNRCELVNKYTSSQNSVTITKHSSSYTLRLDGVSSSNYFQFRGSKFNMVNNSFTINKNSLHTIKGKAYNSLSLWIYCADETVSNSYLIIEVPIKISSTTGGSKIEGQLETLFEEMVNNLDNSSTSYKSATPLDLKHILPKSPYYTYHVKQPNDNKNYDIIFFPPKSSLSIASMLVEKLQSKIECEHDIVYKPAQDPSIELPLYFSESPPKLNTTDGDDIYIDCKPVGRQTDAPKTFITEYIDRLNSASMNQKMTQIFEYIVKFVIAILIISGIIYFPRLFEPSGGNHDNTNSKNSSNNSRQGKNQPFLAQKLR